MRTKQEALDCLKELFSTHFGTPVWAAQQNELAKGAITLGDSFIVASAPGRIELAGNHTDHQGGCTISAAINARVYALASANKSQAINVYMEGFGKEVIALDNLEVRKEEQETSAALIRGMAAAYKGAGGVLHGFDLVVCSDIPVGKGLSSSAAFEMLIGVLLRAMDGKQECLSDDERTELALHGVHTEQCYFGKPCGAQDQLASAHGGIALLDFSQDVPRVTPLSVDFDAQGYALILIDSNSSHADCAHEFASIPQHMQEVASYFGCTRLEDVAYEEALEHLPQLRARLGDKAVLRALHYFEETRRVKAQAQALEQGDFAEFLENVRLSGISSAQYLQNVTASGSQHQNSQGPFIILALCAHLLDGNNAKTTKTLRGAYRMVGGGFGGSIMALVPCEDAVSFSARMNDLLGYDACSTYTVGAPGVWFERLV